MQQTSAYNYIQGLMEDVGITLPPALIQSMASNAQTLDDLKSQIQETPEWKQRFIGNEMRQKNGLHTLPPSQYLNLEDSYRQVMRAAGIPAGFYDHPRDFQKFIANDVSPTEVNQRVQVAADAVNQMNGSAKAALKQYYGIGTGHLVAWALDPKKSLPSLQNMVQTVHMGGDALDQGLHLGGKYVQGLVKQGITESAAENGFQQVAQEKPTATKLAQIDKVGMTEGTLVNAALGTKAKDQAKVQRLASQERARFSAQVGAQATTTGSNADGSGAY